MYTKMKVFRTQNHSLRQTSSSSAGRPQRHRTVFQMSRRLERLVGHGIRRGLAPRSRHVVVEVAVGGGQGCPVAVDEVVGEVGLETMRPSY
jgi:hypothetical protein